MTKWAKFAGICVTAVVVLLSAQAGEAAQTGGNAQNDADTRKVAILPFQINAGPEQERLYDELPAMIEQRLASRGIAVISERTALERMRRDKITSLNIETAKSMVSLFVLAHTVRL